MAQFVMDTAGFHGIAESLAAGDPIDPTALGMVTRVHKVLSSTEWPAELNEAVEHFLATLGEFQAALEADDAAAATSLAETVHDEQHELSERVDGWLGGAVREHNEEG
jgi:glutamine synthetase